MNNLIDNFINQNEKIITFLDQVGRDYKNADENLATYKDFLFETKYNTTLGNDFANFLQCLDKESNFSEFELTDISRLFESLIKTQEFNVDTYLEAGHFEWAVMDNKQKATEIIKSGLANVTAKTEELKRLLETMQEED